MVKEKLIQAFSLIKIEPEVLNDNVDLKNELGMDSQEFIELHCVLEQLFNKRLPDQFVNEAGTFGMLFRKLEQLTAKE